MPPRPWNQARRRVSWRELINPWISPQKLRALSVLIIAFWLLMVGLLIRLQVFPEGSGVRNVPPDHVLGLMFLHRQPSDLSIYSGTNRRIGSLAIRPGRDKQTGERSLTFSGNVQLQLPGVPNQRIVWETQTRFDESLAPRSVRLRVSMRDPDYQLSVSIDATTKNAQYELWSAEGPVDASTVTLTEDGIDELLERLGFDPAKLKALRTGTTQPEILAKRSKFTIRGEEVEAYRITIRQGEQALVDGYISQLGQIMLVKTSLGFRFVGDDLLP